MDRVDVFIANLYQSIEHCRTDSFRETALQLLANVLDFDAALWGSGNYTSSVFHSVVTIGLEPDYPRALEQTQGINPILPALMNNVGHAVDMRSVIDDAAFRDSRIYRECFSGYGVERILSYIAYDARSHVYTLLSLYRFDAERAFSEDERQIFERIAYHLIAAESHAFFFHVALRDRLPHTRVQAAVCDDHGLLYQAQPGFIDLVEEAFGPWQQPHLPFALPPPGESCLCNDLHIENEPLGDLFCIVVRRANPLDALQSRDREIVAAICRGMTFKDIGRELHLAPSTVSNRLYRVYRKLGVTSRSSLVRLIHRSSRY
ncbi:LuxR family transcriptional regulator [Salinisphaera sp. S4-8]|uniref:helix-turn-helix transcriptional regulator n=1 Tax=Salinisphaera sp. S4-8 TaxID=633357 RepID=UPI00333E5FFD